MLECHSSDGLTGQRKPTRASWRAIVRLLQILLATVRDSRHGAESVAENKVSFLLKMKEYGGTHPSLICGGVPGRLFLPESLRARLDA